MYSLKPIFELNDNLCIKSPMYPMKNIHINNTTSETAIPNNILVDVESKQDAILKQINEIKNLLAILKCELSKPKIASADKGLKIMQNKRFDFSKNGIIHEVVLNASVKNPPNSLLVLNKLWPDITFIFSSHMHSSIKELPKHLKVFEKLSTTNNGSLDGTVLRIRIVWKEVWSDCELIVSPLNSTPLLGEVSFLRFLNNCLSPNHIVVSSSLTFFETKLDICHCLLHSDSHQQIQEYYALLGEGLEKNQWLAGDKLTILDIACWSVITNLKNPNLSPSLKRWFKNFSVYAK